MNGNGEHSYYLGEPVAVFDMGPLMKQNIFFLMFIENVRQIYPGNEKSENKRCADLIRHINIAAYVLRVPKLSLKHDELDRTESCNTQSTC